MMETVFNTVSYHADINYSRAITRDWVQNPQATFAQKQLLARAGHAFLLPVSLLAAVTDMIFGTAAGTAAIVTAGLHRRTYRLASIHLSTGSRYIIFGSYIHLLQILNPKAISMDPRLPVGFISLYALRVLNGAALEATGSNNWILKHAISRELHLLKIPVAIVTRVADGAIGLAAAVLSILTFGKIDILHATAMNCLQSTILVHDIFNATMHVINPWITPR